MHLIPGSRAPFSMELVAIAIIVVVPLLLISIYFVGVKKAFATHRWLQLGLSIAILLVLIVFEVQMRTTGWRHLAMASPYYQSGLIPFLYFHVTIAVSATGLWIWTLWGALRSWGAIPIPGQYSPRHRQLGRLTAIMMATTALTGWCFFWMAFLA